MGVEAHRDDTQQEAPARADCEPARLDRDQPVAREFAQTQEFGGEIHVVRQSAALIWIKSMRRRSRLRRRDPQSRNSLR